MSRVGFRSTVAAPRPASAWVLVTVASTTLWITQQLAFPVVAFQVALIVGSLARRTQPYAWQRSALALNTGMLGILALSFGVALRGGPATIALAHFAALTQALQLVDARPRRTEFLLVALALFQVILASNLTDSVFFVPLLAGFVLSTVWTLLVHTLHSEALEAGEPEAASLALTPGLMRTTLIASTLSIALALVLFLVLPRLRSSVVSGSRLGVTLATAGFSDTVALGELGRIRQDPTTVLRVETLEGPAPEFGNAYWRGLAFDHFDGQSWSITPPQRSLVAGSAEGGVTLGRDPAAAELLQRIVREPVAAGVLFGAGRVGRLQGTVRRLERDVNGGLYAGGQSEERVRYTVATHPERPAAAVLRADRSHPPQRAGGRYLQLPPLSPAIGALAARVVDGAATDAERAHRLERFLVQNGRYTDTPPPLDPAARVTPIEAFLSGDLAGHCEYFASAFIVLARSVGLPARLVNGFAGGRENPIGDFVELTRSDAHAWAEVHFERAGWVRFDPTPPDLRARPAVEASLLGQLQAVASAFELWWFQRVVGFDRADQIQALKRAWLAWTETRRRWREPIRKAGPALERPELGGVPWDLAFGGAAACALILAWVRVRRRQRRGDLPPTYAEALRLLERRGVARAPSTTATQLLQRVERELPEAAVPFGVITAAYQAERFGGRPRRAAAAELRALRSSLAGAAARGRQSAQSAP